MGHIVGNIDGASLALYVFFAFFIGLIFWLRREDRREGYPLESDPTGRVKDRGFLLLPKPKTFLLRDGTTYTVPNASRDTRPVAARRVGNWAGAPLTPTGDPLVDGVGPAAWAERKDKPDQTWDGHDKIVPARLEPMVTVSSRDPDPRGMKVIGADGRVAGTVTEIWIDRSEQLVRYLQVDNGEPGTGPLLMPMTLAKFTGSTFKGYSIKVRSITAAQFARVPRTKSTESVTFLEEDRICAYFAGGNLYATPLRTEPLI